MPTEIIFKKGDEIPEQLRDYFCSFSYNTVEKEVGPYNFYLGKYERNAYGYESNRHMGERFNSKETYDTAEEARKDAEIIRDLMQSTLNTDGQWKTIFVQPKHIRKTYFYSDEEPFTTDSLRAEYKERKKEDAEYMIEEFSWFFPGIIDRHFTKSVMTLTTEHWSIKTDAL